MRKTIRTLIVGLALLFPPFINALGGDNDYIILNCQETVEEVVHRSPIQIPLSCLLLTDSIVVTFIYDLGTMFIELENQSLGEYNQSCVNALAGPMILPISGTPGHWLIRFTLPSGVQYYGEFDII